MQHRGLLSGTMLQVLINYVLWEDHLKTGTFKGIMRPCNGSGRVMYDGPPGHPRFPYDWSFRNY